MRLNSQKDKVNMPKLRWCSHCKENSVVRRFYERKDQRGYWWEFCINDGCGYKFRCTALTGRRAGR